MKTAKRKKSKVSKRSQNNIVVSTYKRLSNFSLRQGIAFVVIFGTIGALLLFISRAATNYTLHSYPLVDSQATHSLAVSRATKVLERGSVTGYAYHEAFTNRYLLHFHDTATGQTSNVPLPTPVNPSAQVWAKDNTIWLMDLNPSASGGITIQHLSVNGSPLPTSVSLLNQYTFGDSDSRAVDDMIELASGAIVALYHQQGLTGSQGNTVLYLPTGGQTWQTINLSFMPTASSKARLVQHPADKSIWFFCDPDAWAAMGAAHFTEGPNGLTTDWTNATYLHSEGPENSEGQYIYSPNGENPDVQVAPDPSTGEIVLAYQSDQHKTFQTSPFVKGAYPVIARIKADTTKTFTTTLPVYAERVAPLSLVVRPGEVWLEYLPINSDLTYNKPYASLYRNGVWETPVYLGTISTTGGNIRLTAGISRPEFVGTFGTDVNQLQTQLLSFLPAGSADTTNPTAGISSPSAGSTASGQAAVVVSASDNVGVSKVELLVDGALYGTDVTGPYNFAWDTTKIPNGSHTLLAQAYDAAGNIGTSTTVSVTVQNQAVSPPPDTTAPSVTINSPLGGSTISSSVNISASAADNVAVTSMQVYIDGKLKTSVNAGSLNYTWNSKPAKRSQHIILLKAYDAAGNVGSSQVSVNK
ncbi:MAG TPA: Ig-like domain-containing protein [Candidatus Saccharimonadales bacterium]|nr:Ig-like domain-containing protein [Candidatus Saccharimonadales bacterium]